MIKNIIFDIGKVLISYEPYEYVLSFGYDDKISEELFNIIFEDKRWLELDRGTLSDEDYLKSLINEHSHYKDEIQEIFINWALMLKPMTRSIEFYTNLKNKGYKIYLLSNFAGSAFEKIENQYDFLKLADGKVISYNVKLIKPDKKIYELLLSKYNLIPNECIFIDDKEENVLAAEKLGINIIHFKDIETTRKEFKKIII